MASARELDMVACVEDGRDETGLHSRRRHASDHDRGLPKQAPEGGVDVDLAITKRTMSNIFRDNDQISAHLVFTSEGDYFFTHDCSVLMPRIEYSSASPLPLSPAPLSPATMT